MSTNGPRSFAGAARPAVAFCCLVGVACSGGADSSGRELRAGGTAPRAAYTDISADALPEAVRPRMCMDAAHGDVDADGDLDLVLAIEWGVPALLLNDGSGTFTHAGAAIGGGDGDNEEAILVDLDDDGDLDLITVHEDDAVHALFINDGGGMFEDVSSRIPVRTIANGAEAFDIDGDGRPDIVLGNRGANTILLQQPDGSFTPEPAFSLIGTATTQDIVPADIDGDGDVDLVVANESANQVFIRTADGYTDESASRLPPSNTRETREIDAADIDADEDLDLVVANVAFTGNGSVANQVWANDGTGRFTDVSDSALGGIPNDARSFTIRFADIDRDGDPDILSPDNRIGRGGGLSVWLNDGSGRFSAGTGLFSAPVDGSVFDIEVFDADGDGRDDLYFCHRTGDDQLYLAR